MLSPKTKEQRHMNEKYLFTFTAVGENQFAHEIKVFQGNDTGKLRLITAEGSEVNILPDNILEIPSRNAMKLYPIRNPKP
jgi:hypothetical protein